MLKRFLTAMAILSLLPMQDTVALEGSLPTYRIKLPTGFKIQTYAAGVTGARSMALSPQGTLYVGTRSRNGKVYALPDRNKDGRPDSIKVIAELPHPNGIAFKDNALYVAEISRILRFDNIENNLDNPPKPVVINNSFPTDEWHGWKYIGFGPDGWLYLGVGAPCNVCKRSDERYATMMRVKQDGSSPEVFAHGIRNTVGFDWHPLTKELWFTDNGRDLLGDDMPPDELNNAPRKGMHFGFPYCHGKGIKDPEFGKNVDCAKYTPCAVALGAHVASLGMRFYRGSMFPPEFKHDIFIAEHGSWNRSVAIGYRVTRVHFEKGAAPKYEVFADGWQQPGGHWGRPVDILEMPDGSLLVSDDFAGAIYRISYPNKTTKPTPTSKPTPSK